MKELKPPGNDIQMTTPHENRFPAVAQRVVQDVQKEGRDE